MSQISHDPVFSQETVKDHPELWPYDDGTEGGNVKGEISLSEFQRHFPDPNTFLMKHNWLVRPLVDTLPQYYWPEICESNLPNCITREAAYRFQYLGKVDHTDLGEPLATTFTGLGFAVFACVVNLVIQKTWLTGFAGAAGALIGFMLYDAYKWSRVSQSDQDFYINFPFFLPAKPQIADLGSKMEEKSHNKPYHQTEEDWEREQARKALWRSMMR